MAVTKRSRNSLGRTTLSGFALGVGVIAGNARAANYYLDVNGTTAASGVTNGGSYLWENAIWTTPNSAGTVATVNYVDGNFPRFAAGADATGSYTVTANANHSTVGMILEDGAVGTTLTLDGAGVLSIDPGAGPIPAQQGFIVRGSSNLKVINKVSGTGGISFTTSGGTGSGSLFLYGDNDYSGGTTIGTSGGLNINNSHSLGSGSVAWTVATAVIAAPDAIAPITIANSMTANYTPNVGTPPVATPTSSSVVITGAQPITFTSSWTLQNGVTQTLQAGNTPFPSFVGTLSGPVSGVGTNITKTGPGTLVLAGPNTYSGTTTVTTGKLTLGAANTIASSSKITLNGGTLDPGSFIHTMTSTPLQLTANSTIANPSGGEIDFASSVGAGWGETFVLNVINGIGKLRFGTDANGLSSDQLLQIQFDNNPGTLGSAYLASDGYLLPEPSSAFLLLGIPLLLRRRHRCNR